MGRGDRVGGGTIELPARPSKVAFDGNDKRVAVAFWDSTALVYDLAVCTEPVAKWLTATGSVSRCAG